MDYFVCCFKKTLLQGNVADDDVIVSDIFFYRKRYYKETNELTDSQSRNIPLSPFS